MLGPAAEWMLWRPLPQAPRGPMKNREGVARQAPSISLKLSTGPRKIDRVREPPRPERNGVPPEGPAGPVPQRSQRAEPLPAGAPRTAHRPVGTFPPRGCLSRQCSFGTVYRLSRPPCSRAGVLNVEIVGTGHPSPQAAGTKETPAVGPPRAGQERHPCPGSSGNALGSHDRGHFC
jgi:hypothetical protein